MGRPGLQDLSRRSPTCSPTYSLPSPWSTLRGGGHGDAQLAQLVWLVLASWPRRALRRSEDEAGRAHRKSRGGEATNRYDYIKHPLAFSTSINQQIDNVKDDK